MADAGLMLNTLDTDSSRLGLASLAGVSNTGHFMLNSP